MKGGKDRVEGWDGTIGRGQVGDRNGMKQAGEVTEGIRDVDGRFEEGRETNKTERRADSYTHSRSSYPICLLVEKTKVWDGEGIAVKRGIDVTKSQTRTMGRMSREHATG